MTVATWALIALLIAFNGLYVAAEFAAVSVRRSRIHGMAEGGDRLARTLLPILKDSEGLDRYVAACQVGITLSSLVLGAYGQASLGRALTPVFERWGSMQTVAAQSASAVVVLVALTTVQMILGELVPKSLALQYPTRVARFTVLPIRWSQRALGWFIALLNGSGWLILRLLRVEPKPHRHLHSAEEIRFVVAESRAGGQLEPEEQRRFHHALGLTQRTARELMVPRIRVVGVDEAAGLDTAVEAGATLPYTRIPVYRESIDQIVGLVHTKDLAAASLSERADDPASLRAIMRPMLAVHESLTANRVLALMREKRGIMAVVVDDFGGTAGIITTEDILSELLGNVADEFKDAVGEPEQGPDGRLRLPGGMLVREARRWVGAPWESEADTVGGLVMERLGRMPVARDTLEIDGVDVEVEEVLRRAVVGILVRPADPPGSEPGR